MHTTHTTCTHTVAFVHMHTATPTHVYIQVPKPHQDELKQCPLVHLEETQVPGINLIQFLLLELIVFWGWGIPLVMCGPLNHLQHK